MTALVIVLVVLLAAAAVLVGYRIATRADRGPVDLEPPPPATAAAPPAPPEVEARPEVEAPPAPAEVEARPEVEAPPARPRLRDRLGKTRAALGGYVHGLRGRSRIDDDVWDELEEMLLLADVGVETTTRLLDAVRADAAEQKLTSPDAVVDLLELHARRLLDETPDRSLVVTPGERNVWMFVGVNGVGKTTSIGKLAAQQQGEGRRVLLAAADTFRAAAAEQLSSWAERIDAEVVRGQEGADPGSIVFDAMAAAGSREVDLVLVDTAGRLHTKSNLMEELKKLRRIVDRTEGALKEVLLVIDASTGQNGLTQARQFAQAVEVSGIVLTKLDGTAKGGIVLAIQADLGIPVKAVGVGEGVEDLVAFDPAEFAAALFEE